MTSSRKYDITAGREVSKDITPGPHLHCEEGNIQRLSRVTPWELGRLEGRHRMQHGVLRKSLEREVIKSHISAANITCDASAHLPRQRWNIQLHRNSNLAYFRREKLSSFELDAPTQDARSRSTQRVDISRKVRRPRHYISILNWFELITHIWETRCCPC